MLCIVLRGSERSTCSAVERAWREQARACFALSSHESACFASSSKLLACFASSSENYTSRKTAISPLHPAISTRRRGRGAGRFYTRSKRPATPRGECDGSCAADPPGTRMRWSVRGMHARRRRRALGRRARVRRQRGAHIMWCLAIKHHSTSKKNTKGSRTPALRAQMGSPPAADTRPNVLQQTRAVWGAGAALPRCLGPRSDDLQRTN